MKNELREKAIEIRKRLNTEELSKKILQNLVCLEEYKRSKNIICYYPLPKEVNTIPLLNDTSKNWYLPRVNGSKLEICKYNKGELTCGSFNIQEPIGQKLDDLTNIDMIIVPAIAADKNGYRLGWGKGYYDRFLSSFVNKHKTIVLVYSELVFDTVYPQNHDVKCSILISDKEIFRIDC